MALILILFAVLATEALALKFPSLVKEPTGDSTATDLTAIVRPSPIEKSAVYSEALQILTSIQASPSCHRLAASNLLNSCQSIEEAPSDTEPSLDDVKAIYAAQLAICEIISAGSAVPQQCKPLTPRHETKGRRGFSGIASGGSQRPNDKHSSEHLSQCLQTLESRPQWWTSYSNSRQNAVIMCRAARVEIEKDDLIELHKSIVKLNSGVNSALSEALADANAQLLKQQKFAVAVDSFQKQLLHELKDSGAEAQSFLHRMMKSMDAAAQTLLSQFSLATKEAETTVAGLTKNVQQSNVQAVELQQKIKDVFQRVVQGSSELAAVQMKQWDLSHGLASDLKSSLESIRENDLQMLLGAFGVIHNQLQMSNELISRMYFRQDELDQRLVSLDRSFAGLETKAQAFHAAQTLQVDVQTRLHDQMQVEMQVTRGLLADVTSSATTLQAAVDKASAKIAQMATFGGLSATVVQWSWLLLVILILYQLSPRIAGFATAGIGTFILLSFSGTLSPFSSIHSDTVLVHYASGYQIRVVTLVKITIFLGILAGAGIVYSLRARLGKIIGPNFDNSSDLAFWGLRAPSWRIQAWHL